MPIYEYQCLKCLKVQDAYRKVAERENSPECCGQKTKKIISNYNVHPDFEPYIDHNLTDKPQWVKSKQHRKKLMQEHGVTEGYGKGWH